MTVAPIVTVESAIQLVLGSLDQLDDGVSDPILIARVLSALNRAQRQLERTAPHLRMRREARSEAVGGIRLVDLPADARYGAVSQVLHISAAGTRTELMPGINREFTPYSDIPSRFDLAPSTGIVSVTLTDPAYDETTVVLEGGTRVADGCDPVIIPVMAGGVATSFRVDSTGAGWSTAPTFSGGTILLGPVVALELYPTPIDGTLVLDYLAGVYDMVEETDTLSLDAEAVTGLAAWMVATKRFPGIADALLATHNAYMKAFAAQQRPGQIFSMRRNMPIQSTDPLRRYAR